MPELPEVETVRRVLDEKIRGQNFLSYSLGSPTFYRLPNENFLKSLKGSNVSGVLRRGKYLILGFENHRRLILHLGMSGRIHFAEPSSQIRMKLCFSKAVLCFEDVRRFGRVMENLPALGLEPLSEDFNASYLAFILKNKRAAVKSVLMDQAVVAGLGNIYATEALYHSQIRPGRKSHRVTLDETQRLSFSIKEILREAISCGGTTLPDESYLDPLGRAGSFQNQLKIYGKKQCPQGHSVLRTRQIIAGRRAYYCPVCQR